MCEDVVICQADLNNSGSVLADDGAIVAEQWMRTGCDPGTPGTCCTGDINNSGSVMADDGAIVAEQWMTMGCPDRVPLCTEL